MSAAPSRLRQSFACTLIIALLGITGCGKTSDTAASKEPATDDGSVSMVLSPTEFKAKREASPQGILLDVRTPSEIAEGRISGAIAMDIGSSDFDAKAKSLPKDVPILLYCRSGRRSQNAANHLKSIGFKEIYDLDGGISAWERAGLPIERSQR